MHAEMLYHWITVYGYFGVFALLMLGIIGLPVPDETVLALVGYLAFRGDLQLVPAYLAGFLGSICGISLSYLIGRRRALFIPFLTVHRGFGFTAQPALLLLKPMAYATNLGPLDEA
jgi:membrane protein DedA with SNARE-associated domain